LIIATWFIFPLFYLQVYHLFMLWAFYCFSFLLWLFEMSMYYWHAKRMDNFTTWLILHKYFVVSHFLFRRMSYPHSTCVFSLISLIKSLYNFSSITEIYCYFKFIVIVMAIVVFMDSKIIISHFSFFNCGRVLHENICAYITVSFSYFLFLLFGL